MHAVPVGRIVIVTRPAQEAEVVEPVLRVEQISRVIPDVAVRHDGEPDVLEHLGHGLVEAPRIRHVRARDLGRIPEVDRRGVVLTVAGVLEELTRSLGVERIGLDPGDDGVIPTARRRDEHVRRRSATAVERLDQRGLVDRHADGLADRELGERRFFVAILLGDGTLRGGCVLTSQRIQAKVQGVEREPLDQREAVALHRLVVRRVDQVVALDAAALEGLQSRRRIRDRTDDHPIEVRGIAPVILVSDQCRVVVGNVVLEQERTGSALDHIGPEGAGGRIIRVGRLQDRRADHAERSQRDPVQEGRIRLAQGDRDRELVGRLDAGDQVIGTEAVHDGAVVVGARLELLGRVLPAVEVELHRLGIEGRAVMEGHVLAQVEDVFRVFWPALPGLGQHADELIGGARSEVDERLVDLLQDPERLAVTGQERVEARCQARSGEHQGAARLSFTAGAAIRRLRGRRARVACRRLRLVILRRAGSRSTARGEHENEHREDGENSPVTHPLSSKVD